MIKWFEKNNKVSWGVTILLALTIFYVSSMTFESSAGSQSFGLKATLYHIIIFFIFSFFLSISLTKGKNKKFILLAIGISILYGLSDEFHQSFVPGRVSSLSDVFLDSVGILFAIVIYFISIESRRIKLFND